MVQYNHAAENLILRRHPYGVRNNGSLDLDGNLCNVDFHCMIKFKWHINYMLLTKLASYISLIQADASSLFC